MLWGCIVHLLCPSSCVNVFPSLLHLQPETAEPGKQGGLKAWMMSGLLEMDLTEAEDIKKRWQEYTEELYKKDLHDPDN